jgi:hypothetical protein
MRAHGHTMVLVDNVQIRLAQASDLEQLARLCEALWPQSFCRGSRPRTPTNTRGQS